MKKRKGGEPPQPPGDEARALLSGLLEAEGADGGVAGGMQERDARKAVAFLLDQEASNPLAEYTFEISGDAPTAKRPRSNFRTGVVYAKDDADQLNLGQLMKLQLPKGFVPMEGAVLIFADVYKPIPTGFPEFKKALAEAGYIRPEVKPDFDNYAKILVDAMRRRLFLDDSQAVEGYVRKFFSRRPRTEVLVRGRARRMYK